MNDLRIPYYGAIKTSRYERNNKLNIGPGYSEEQARKDAIDFAQNVTFEELDSKTSARISVEGGTNSIGKRIGLSEEEIKEFNYASIHGPADAPIFKIVGDRIPKDNLYKFMIDILSDVHDVWVKNNSKKFNSVNIKNGQEVPRAKEYQHLPLQLIGFDEVKLDLIYVEPIVNACGIEIDEKELKAEYDKSVEDFFIENNAKKISDFHDEIMKGENFYPALEGQDNVNELLKQGWYVSDIVLPQVEEKGIGKDKESLEKIYKNIEQRQINNQNID